MKRLSKLKRKFTTDITHGILASGSCFHIDVIDQLHEDSNKINVVNRLSRHLNNRTPTEAASSHLQQIKSKPVYFTKQKIMKLTFPMTKFKSQLQEKLFF